MKTYSTIIAAFLLFILVPTSTIDYVLDNVFTLQTTSSLSPVLALESELAAINSGNHPPVNHFIINTGYRIEPVIWNLTLPSSITFDNENHMYIAEAGFIYGGLQPIPRILKVDSQSEWKYIDSS
jgi:hypothetical protein